MATITNAKELLIQALNNDLPAEGFSEFLDVQLPEFDNSDMDAQTAIIWEGKLSRYLCAVCTLFLGLKPLEIPLRIGQRNVVQQGMYLAMLQATRTVGRYYEADYQAEAEALNEQIESVQPIDGNVSIDEGFWQQIYAGTYTLLKAFQASPETTESIGDMIQITEAMCGIMEGFAENLSEIGESTWRSLTSLSRLLLSRTGGIM